MLEMETITFDGENSAERKLDELNGKRDDPWLAEVGILQHDTKGEYSLKGANSGVDDGKTGKGASIGGLTGAAVGLIGGPAGLLAWTTIGATTGAAVGASKESAFRPVFEQMKDRLPSGSSMLVLVGETPSIDAFEGAVGAKKSAVTRHALTNDQAKELSERSS